MVFYQFLACNFDLSCDPDLVLIALLLNDFPLEVKGHSEGQGQWVLLEGNSP